MLLENGEARSRRSGEGGEYFVSPHNTAVILISTSIHCDIVLVERGESRHNQKYAMDALVQEYEAVVLMILCESMGPIIIIIIRLYCTLLIFNILRISFNVSPYFGQRPPLTDATRCGRMPLLRIGYFPKIM